MSESVFCYHCRRHHPRAEVVLVDTRGVKRWRCRQSLELCRRSVDQRDAFGRAVSAANQRAGATQGLKPLPRPVLELMFARSPAAERAA